MQYQQSLLRITLFPFLFLVFASLLIGCVKTLQEYIHSRRLTKYITKIIQQFMRHKLSGKVIYVEDCCFARDRRSWPLCLML